MKRKILFNLLAVLSLLLGLAGWFINPPAAMADGGTHTIIYQPGPTEGKDAYVGHPNYGEPAVNVGSEIYIGAWNSGAHYARGLIEFDVSSLPNTAISVKLQLYGIPRGLVDTPQSPIQGDVSLYQVTSPWDEMTVTWNTLPSFNGTAIDTETPDTERWYEWDITALYNAWKSGASTNYGLIMIENMEETYKSGIICKSSDYGDQSLRPRLLITTAATNLAATTGSPEIYPGDSVSMTLNIQNASDLYAAQATCTVDPAVQQLQSVAFGDFFDPVNRLVGANVVSPTLGTWLGAISQCSPAGSLSGDGLFATVTYTATSPGTTSITCDPLLSDRDGFTQTVSFTGDSVTVLPFATIEGAAQYQGRIVHAGITVTATGPITLTTATAASGDFMFDTVRAGDYTVEADAALYLPSCAPVPGVDPGEVIALGSTTLKGGDVNDDDVINIGDATMLGNRFGEDDPAVDINADDTVNVQDLAILGGNYELSGCQSW
jgi:hypothetical protein